MEFTVRLAPGSDRAMLLFQVRRLKGEAEAWEPPRGGGSVYLRGSLPEENVDSLVQALEGRIGAVHAGDRHIALRRNGIQETETVEEAERHLGGPYTDEALLAGAYNQGDAVKDHVLQVLYHAEGELALKAFTDQGIAPDAAMAALQALRNQGLVRLYRRESNGQPVTLYGLAGEERSRIEGRLEKARTH